MAFCLWMMEFRGLKSVFFNFSLLFQHYYPYLCKLFVKRFSFFMARNKKKQLPLLDKVTILACAAEGKALARVDDKLFLFPLLCLAMWWICK